MQCLTFTITTSRNFIPKTLKILSSSYSTSILSGKVTSKNKLLSPFRIQQQRQQYSINNKFTSLISKNHTQLYSTTSSPKFTKVSNIMPAAQQSIIPNSSSSYIEDSIDPSQLELLAEECILVNDQDQIIGHDSKKKCHLIDPITGDIPLHRAFSVFLFNTKGQLLLQQRSKTKITFPSMYSNTCCSHPLYTNNDELAEADGLGAKVAAQRRLYEELGIPKEQIPIEAFHYLTRVHYKANSGSSIWGEHEIDYILFIQADVQIQPNPNEVDDVKYLSLDEFNKFTSSKDVEFTPWFHLISKSGKLQEWWNGMNNLKQFQDFDKIYRL